MTDNELRRLENYSEKVWNDITDDEREAFYNDTGTIGFIECMANLLHIHLTDDDRDTVDDIQKRRCRVNKEHTRVVTGDYVPTRNVTVIFEDTYNEKNEIIRVAVKGFYYGEPDDWGNKEFYDDLLAVFDD